MAHVSLGELNAWTEPTKLTLSAVDEALDLQVSGLVFARLMVAFPTTTWTNEAATPALIRTIIAMHYIAWYYDKHYAQEEEASAYAALLRAQADANISMLLSGDVTLAEYTLPDGTHQPSFFPNDDSSSRPSSTEFPSEGGPSFMMGTVF